MRRGAAEACDARVQPVATTLDAILASGVRIADIVGVIDDVAVQTKIRALALSAAKGARSRP